MSTPIDEKNILTCLAAVCAPKFAGNPVAWADLELAGFPREVLEDVSAKPGWIGPRPLFYMAPDRDGGMWKHLMKSRTADHQHPIARP